MVGLRVAVSLLLGIATILGWSTSGACNNSVADETSRATQEDAIREAVIRYQMDGWGSSGDKVEQDAKDPRDKYIAKRLNSRVYFVSVNGKDPSDEFLKRFQGVPRTVKRMSDAKQTKKPDGGWVIDKKTKQPGIIFSANVIRWLNDSEVEVDGGYHCGGLCASGEVFTVTLENGKWKVIADRMKWIS
jgi:hypothetical protein